MPKQITHTLLVTLGAGVLLFILWIQTDQKKQDSHYIEIVDVSSNGIIFSDISEPYRIDSPKLAQPSNSELAQLRSLMLGKWLAREKLSQPLHLPIELFDPLCFSDESHKIQGLRCPTVILTP